MPRGNRTGPMGMGPMTGRSAGYCAGYDSPGFMSPQPGRMFGAGLGGGFWGGRGGRGRGWRHMYWATNLPGRMRPGRGGMIPGAEVSSGTERQYLQEQAGALQAQLDAIKKRVDELSEKNLDKS